MSRLYSLLLEVPRGPGAAEAGLHLVDDQEGPLLPGRRGDRLEVAGLRRREAERRGDRLENNRRGPLVDDIPQSSVVVERDVGEARRAIAERLKPARIASGPAEPGQAVVGTERRDDPLAPGVGPRHAHREVHGLGAGRCEDRIGKHSIGARGELRAEAGTPAANQVVVADVEVIERLMEGPNRTRMSMSEVEHATVAVAVPVPAPAVGVAKPRSLALPDDDVHPHRMQSVSLAAAHVGGERRCRLSAAGVGQPSGRGLGASSAVHSRPPIGVCDGPPTLAPNAPPSGPPLR